MKDCTFCKIAEGSLESAKIWEDELFIAVFDVNPNTKGMTLLLSKEHYDSYIFDMPSEIYTKFMLAGREVADTLEKGLGVKRVALVMEGMGINHAHLKFYPLHGVKQKFKEMWGRKRIFCKTYKGYITTQLGPPADLGQLKKFAKEIRKR